MQQLIIFGCKGLKKAIRFVVEPINYLVTCIVFYSNGIQFLSFKTHGVPKVNVGLGGKCSIGKNFRMNNYEMANPIGRFHACSIIVGNRGELTVGDNVGISSTAIVCQDRIEIGNNVHLGGNVVIYDTDFHSLKAEDRLCREEDVAGTKTSPVKLGHNAFIGAHSTILKGVSIGDNSIVGACSVVTKNIPDNQIWAGNPAKFIRNNISAGC
jgi:acetyltransferase-like isoleucine patch superfamily enzyme